MINPWQELKDGFRGARDDAAMLRLRRAQKRAEKAALEPEEGTAAHARKEARRWHRKSVITVVLIGLALLCVALYDSWWGDIWFGLLAAGNGWTFANEREACRRWQLDYWKFAMAEALQLEAEVLSIDDVNRVLAGIERPPGMTQRRWTKIVDRMQVELGS